MACAEFVSRKLQLPVVNPLCTLDKELQEAKLLQCSLDECNAEQRSMSENKQQAMISAFHERIAHPDCSKGYVLVQYPETVKQYRELADTLGKTEFVPVTFELDNEVRE
jgi:adenylate kinase family enzyme